MMVLPPAAAVIVPFANPRVAYDLGVYSRRYGLPPARLKVIDYGRAPGCRRGRVPRRGRDSR